MRRTMHNPSQFSPQVIHSILKNKSAVAYNSYQVHSRYLGISTGSVLPVNLSASQLSQPVS